MEMNSIVGTHWVKTPHQRGGLDHLGVQAPCIQIYGNLLPGITNVTDRARYYSFYPWLFAQFEDQGWREDEQIVQMLRRADCLLTMISLRHAEQEGGPSEIHRAAMVGSDTLGRALSRVSSGERVPLSDYAHREEGRDDRYFMNNYGGLGQYYFGVLRGLGLFDGDSVASARVVKETGVALARITSQSVPGERFIQVLIDDELGAADLDELSGFCACGLSQPRAEAESSAISQLLLNGWSSLYPEGTQTVDEIQACQTRSHSLAYLSLLADAASDKGIGFDTQIFRAQSYTLCGPDGEKLQLPESLQVVCDGWKAYQRNELASVALQGLFFAHLRAAELGGPSFETTSDLSDWFWQHSIGHEVVHRRNRESAGELLSAFYKDLPEISEWTNDGHEIQLMDRLQRLTNKEGTSLSDVSEVTEDSLAILSAIVMRPENSEGYGQYRFPDNYLAYYPVNLESVQADWKGSISELPVDQGLSSFSRVNCLDAHLRVAMRKLRQQGQNTFRFEPSERGLLVKAIPRAANTTPRFRQALRMLLDLGLLVSEKDLIRTTTRGKEFVASAV
jgi:hypothetical protein